MGLNKTWDDSTKANDNVPALNETWEYGKMPIRGVNVGGWLNLEPFITPSYFSQYGSKDNVVDEWTKMRANISVGKREMKGTGHSCGYEGAAGRVGFASKSFGELQ